MPCSGRRISSPTGRRSSRFWQASTLKLRRTDAKTTFSSIRAKRWPEHWNKRETWQHKAGYILFSFRSERIQFTFEKKSKVKLSCTYLYSCGVQQRRARTHMEAFLLNSQAENVQAWTPQAQGSIVGHGEECKWLWSHLHLWERWNHLQIRKYVY